jgi:hypothetical protein
MDKEKICKLSISTKDGRILADEQLIATRVTLDNIPKEKEFVEIDLQLIVKRKEAELIYNALCSGVIYVEINEATTS